MKKLQNKILLIFFIIGTIIIIGMGAFFAGIVGETQDFIGTSEYVTSQDLINITDTQMNQAKNTNIRNNISIFLHCNCCWNIYFRGYCKAVK